MSRSDQCALADSGPGPSRRPRYSGAAHVARPGATPSGRHLGLAVRCACAVSSRGMRALQPTPSGSIGISNGAGRLRWDGRSCVTSEEKKRRSGRPGEGDGGS